MVSGKRCPCHKDPTPVKVGTEQHDYQTRSDQWCCTSPFIQFYNKIQFVWLWSVWSVKLKMSDGLVFMKYTRGFRTRGIMETPYTTSEMFMLTYVNMMQICLGA